jgi:histone-lysine N-methyltransferase SETMAR
VPFKNPDHHNQWLSPGQPSASTPKKDFRQEKRMLCVFWDRRHVIHWELLEEGQTVNKEHLEHPPYSPDLAPSDFHLFRALEHFLRGKRFENIGEMRVSLGQFFDSKPQDFYRRGIYLLPEKWQQVIDVDGEYFD